MLKLDMPPVFQITEDLIPFSSELKAEDVGRWAIVLPGNKILCCNDQDEAFELRDSLAKVEIEF